MIRMLDGFIVQLPLPKHISEQKMIEAIDPKKDVDGFHPDQCGPNGHRVTCIFNRLTPYGIVELLKRYGD
jgi:methylenetetrahydrofolate dehydrogenase (NADP+) / methenyltetrahydrofolate cyclohydrolase